MTGLEVTLEDRTSLEALCERYAAAFESQKASSISESWDMPAQITVHDRNIVFSTREKFDANTDMLLAFYVRQGVKKVSRRLENVLKLAQDAAAITVLDKVFGGDGSLICAWRAAYLVRRNAQGAWQNVSGVADGEVEAWRAIGVELGK